MKTNSFQEKYFPTNVNTLSALQEFLKERTVDKPLGNFDAIPYLCSLIKNAGNDELNDEAIENPRQGFDYDGHLQSYYKQLTAITDGRINFYEVWQYIEQNIIPRADAQIEVLQRGGCTIIDDYLCDTITGQKIKQFKNTCNVEFSKPVTYDEVVTTVDRLIKEKRESYADAFIKYLKYNYLDKYLDKPIANRWSAKLIYYSNIFIFYVELTKKSETEFIPNSTTEYKNDYEIIKYYSDMKDYVSEKLKINLTIIQNNTLEFGIDRDAFERSTKLIQNLSDGKMPNYVDITKDYPV